MAVYHEVKEVTQLEETLLSFQLEAYTDDLFRGQPLQLTPVVMTSGSSPFDPTIRLTVKAKADDPDAFALFQKTVPPFPNNGGRWGVIVDNLTAGGPFFVSGGILYQRGNPWWYWYQPSWPPGYSYSPTTPPTNWEPLGSWVLGPPDYLNAFSPYVGDISFRLRRYETWFPPGDYLGLIEIWRTGAGTPPAGAAPELVLQCTLRINKTLRRSPFF